MKQDEQKLDWQALYKSILENKESIKKMRISQEKSQKETDRQIKKVSKLIGNHTNNVGEVTEEFFYRGLAKKKTLGNIKFDVVRRNIGSAKEYDILMVNGDTVAVISVKYKLHQKDIETFTKQDLKDFKKLFPEFKHYKVKAGIAAKSMTESLEKKIKDLGLFVITQSGKNIEILNDSDFEGRDF